jgi:hypothetical protein
MRLGRGFWAEIFSAMRLGVRLMGRKKLEYILGSINRPIENRRSEKPARV